MSLPSVAIVRIDVRNVPAVAAFEQRIAILAAGYAELAIGAGATEEGRIFAEISDALQAALLELEFASDEASS